MQAEDFQRFFEVAGDAFFIVGYDGRIRMANAAAKALLRPPDGLLPGTSVMDLCHADDRTALAEAFDRLASGSAVHSMETRFLVDGGECRWILWDAVPLPEKQCVCATAHDITEHKARHDHRFRTVFETSADSVIILDAKTGHLIEVNPQALQTLGLEAGSFDGVALWELEAFQDGGLGREVLAALENDVTFRREMTIGSGGERRYFDLQCNSYSGEKPLIQCRLREITQRKRAESALRDSEDRFRILVEGVQDYAIIMMDPEGTIVSWNPAAERILGYSEQEAVGCNTRMIFTPEDQALGEADKEQEKARTEGRAEDERWHLRKDGSRFFASGVLTALRRPDGRLHGFAKVMRDITGRKQQEEAMREAQKLESIGLLAGGVAHDFNNLLTGIIGNASLALDELPTASPGRRLIENVLGASKRAADLTRQLLAYAGKGRFTVETFSVSEAVSEILDLVHTSIPESIELDLDLARDLPVVEGDRTQIHQVVMNLAINAAEAIEGKGRIHIRTRQRFMSAAELSGHEGLQHLQPGNYVYVEVEDTGSGMPEETRLKIFDPFFTTKFTGRGLGLAAVSGIVRGHGGGIHVTTVPGQGSRFQVFLPAVTAGSERSSRDQGKEMTAVLIADDDEIVRSVACEALQRYGYDVIVARDGLEAVELFRKNAASIRAVVLDMAMPVMSGEEAYRELRAIRSDVPVLIASGYSEMMMTERFGEGKAFIQKPFTPNQLARHVAALLNGRAPSESPR